MYFVFATLVSDIYEHVPVTNPEVNKYLNDGGLSVKIFDVNTFGRIHMDQAIEETANKDT